MYKVISFDFWGTIAVFNSDYSAEFYSSLKGNSKPFKSYPPIPIIYNIEEIQKLLDFRDNNPLENIKVGILSTNDIVDSSEIKKYLFNKFGLKFDFFNFSQGSGLNKETEEFYNTKFGKINLHLDSDLSSGRTTFVKNILFKDSYNFEFDSNNEEGFFIKTRIKEIFSDNKSVLPHQENKGINSITESLKESFSIIANSADVSLLEKLLESEDPQSLIISLLTPSEGLSARKRMHLFPEDLDDNLCLELCKLDRTDSIILAGALFSGVITKLK